MAERGPSLAEIIGAKLTGVFPARRRDRDLAVALPVRRRVKKLTVPAVLCVADERLVSAYRDLLRLPA